MISFLLSQDNLPYAIALCIVAILGIVESLSLVIGASFLGLLDDWTPNDNDPELADSSGIAGWLCIDRLPLFIWFVLALICFAVAGFSVNYLSQLWFNELLSQSVSMPVSLVIMGVGCHFIGYQLANYMPKNRSSIVFVEDLNGCVGTLTAGNAVQGQPSEAIVNDDEMQRHCVLVEPDQAGVEFSNGTQVVLLKRKGSIWSAAKVEAS
ncbi:OB-fold-containig protein [Shewanella youngdeokensis]|uniref:DUF1449 family protein n=1 Tax=Shewanella youngdeokensis TaxID=2999068 RepID=A0ABZ0JZM5_9GAMM|nr:DUF1449 family protein [Shewanella sp. DAU334]